ncbi:MAG: ATP-binding protein, partial [Chloroflexota bacterium]
RDLEPLLAYAIDEVLRLVGAERGYIVLVNEDNSLDFRIQRTADGQDIASQADSISRSILDEVVAKSESSVVEDAMLDPRFSTAMSVMMMRLRSIMCAPLITQNRTVGAIYVENRSKVGQFSKENVAPLEFFSNQAAVSIENAYLYNNLEQLVEDRTEALVLAKEEADASREKAEIANQAKSDFLSNMSHELRTPLNGILGYAQILKRKQMWDQTVLDGLSIIDQSGNHLLTLINDVLDLAKIEARKMELYPAHMRLEPFLQGIAGIMQMRAREKGLHFSFEAKASLPAGIEADETRLRQILINLLGNAVKFTNQGQVTLKVSRPKPQEIENDTLKQATLRFEVIDTGVGISDTEVKKIFEPFEQVGEAKQRREGTGLGLTISQQLVELMGSRLQVESILGQGSTFWFEILVNLVDQNSIEGALGVHPQIIGYNGERQTAIVIDDREINRFVIRDMLTTIGFDVLEATNGAEGIVLTAEHRPDLILLDLVMPVKNGFEAAKEIRQNPKLKDIPIIAISASAYTEDQAKTQAVGIDAFLPKPVHEEKLLTILTELLPLDWIYEETTSIPEIIAEEAPLIAPPQNQLQALYDVAKLGNMRGIREQA